MIMSAREQLERSGVAMEWKVELTLTWPDGSKSIVASPVCGGDVDAAKDQCLTAAAMYQSDLDDFRRRLREKTASEAAQ
jgi:hypothetical protein